MALEVVARGDRFDHVLIVVQLAEEIAEEERPLVPPVSEELGVVGADDDRRTVHVRRQTLRPAAARFT